LQSTNKPLPVFFTKYKNELILTGCWLIVQAFLFRQHGMQTDFEARKYIDEADNLLVNGSVSSPNFWLYSVQIFLIAAVKKIHATLLCALIVQWFFSLLAVLSLYRLSSNLANKTTGIVIAILLIFNIPLQTFNSFLQTESLFFSFTILFGCYLLRVQKLNGRNFSFIISFLLLLCFTRPTGLLWIPCTFLYLFFRFFRGFPFLVKIGTTIFVCIGFLFLLNLVLGSGGELDFMLPFRDEMIICGVPTLTAPANIRTTGNPNSLFGLAYYMTHNFDQFIRLSWLRTKAFWGLSRSYYSSGHNLYLCLWFYPLYALAIYGGWRWVRKNKYLFLYCLSLILITWATVILTCDDWHNRFFLTVVPYIYILSIPAVAAITAKLKRTANK
jgi:hypothetical protein